MMLHTYILATISIAAIAAACDMNGDVPSAQYHRVKQDHLNNSNNKTWLQAYYVNDTYWKGSHSDAPVFLCVGGEGPPMDGSAVRCSDHCNNAAEWLKETGALMFAVEHRYYGCHNRSACPVDDVTKNGALRFLSSRQALADLASFHTHAVSRFNLTDRNLWVSWGGSYPGMLAGWFHLKYSPLIHAAVASSAPVNAILNMRGYNDVVAKAYTVKDNLVGGSEECREAIARGHADIGAMLATKEGRKSLALQFNLPSGEWLTLRSNQRRFAGEGVAVFPAQSNDPACMQPGCNIARICEIMTNTTLDHVRRLAHLRELQIDHGVFKNAPKHHHTETYSLEVDYWGYQTCTEFGFYQTCDIGTHCFFTQGLDTLFDEESFCQSRFNISFVEVKRNIAMTNRYYGALNPVGKRILFVNGEVDPWRSQSILKSPSSGIEVLEVPGASHHAWTHPSPIAQTSVQYSRQIIRNKVTAWLNEKP